MILNACAKRSATPIASLSSVISRRCFGGSTSTNALTRNRNRPFTRPLRYGCMQMNANVRNGSSCLWQQQQQRHLSAFANTAPRSSSSQTRRPTPKRKRKQKKQQQQQEQLQQQQQQQLPKWTATASVLIVPFMFAAWGVSDWIFGNRTKGHNEGLRQEFLEEQRRRRQTDSNVDDNNNNNDGNINDSWLSSLDTQPTLFHCVIRKNAGLKHCLSGVQLGDVVEVLEEGVGPDKAYNLCRLPAKQEPPPAHNNESEGEGEGEQSTAIPSLSRDVYGWFPIRWLQKLDHYESIVREQQHNIMSSEDAK